MHGSYPTRITEAAVSVIFVVTMCVRKQTRRSLSKRCWIHFLLLTARSVSRRLSPSEYTLRQTVTVVDCIIRLSRLLPRCLFITPAWEKWPLVTTAATPSSVVDSLGWTSFCYGFSILFLACWAIPGGSRRASLTYSTIIIALLTFTAAWRSARDLTASCGVTQFCSAVFTDVSLRLMLRLLYSEYGNSRHCYVAIEKYTIRYESIRYYLTTGTFTLY